MNIAYVRVSTIEQSEARQVEALRVHQIDKWFREKVSGKDTNRPQLQAMLEFAREGDTIYIHDFSALPAALPTCSSWWKPCRQKISCLVSNKENIDTHTPTGKLMLTMIAAINEFERMNLLERQREGIAIAKRKGIYKGRKPGLPFCLKSGRLLILTTALEKSVKSKWQSGWVSLEPHWISY